MLQVLTRGQMNVDGSCRFAREYWSHSPVLNPLIGIMGWQVRNVSSGADHHGDPLHIRRPGCVIQLNYGPECFERLEIVPTDIVEVPYRLNR